MTIHPMDEWVNGKSDAESLADDLLNGCAKIARFLGMTQRQVYYAYECTGIPIFKLSASPRAALMSRKSSLRVWIAEREREAAAASAARTAKKQTKGRNGAAA